MYEILINKNQEEKEVALVENGKLIEYYKNSDNDNIIEGNIYIGIVKDIIKGMQAAFVDIGVGKNSFIHVKDSIPQIDEKREKFNENIAIRDVLKSGQKILVQVKKDSSLQKGARISTHINLAGKYIAYMPNTDIITVSQKITDKKEQERLIKIVKENISEGNGAVIRTSAVGKEKEIVADIKNAEKKWQKIEKEYKNDKDNKPRLIMKSEGIAEKMIIDLPEKSIEKIITNDINSYDTLKKYSISIEMMNDENPFEKYNLKNEIEKINNRKIWLKCGGFITIDNTEALTAIDVNTGKYTGKRNIEETILRVNQEATIEIAKQLRLKDIGGIIIIDYIDMKDEKDKEKIENLLIDELKKDRTKTQVEGFTKLDLMELTRKHICSHQE